MDTPSPSVRAFARRLLALEAANQSAAESQQLAPDQLERAIGPEVLDNLVQQTGLSREELLTRLTRILPEAVDKYTPEGRLPTAVEADRLS